MNWVQMTEIELWTNKTKIMVRSWSETIQSQKLLELDKILGKYNNDQVQGRVLETEKRLLTSHHIELDNIYWKKILGRFLWNSREETILTFQIQCSKLLRIGTPELHKDC